MVDKQKADSITVYLYDTVAQHVHAVQNYPNKQTAIRALTALVNHDEYRKQMPVSDIKVFYSEVYYSEAHQIANSQPTTLIDKLTDLESNQNV